jgi:glycosyltransferase involved in cell wall biosynthesis/predicted metal-dependent phosphoesterase TrpH
MANTAASRADMHCHSTASELSRLGVQRSLGLPECATPPEEVYETAKRRGMDFVTITDHDTIAGVMEITDRSDVFVSEELTAWFRGEPQAVHVLCYGITPDDHDWLQSNAGDLEACAGYLHDGSIACALAHPFYMVAAQLTPRHRRRLAELFPIWETCNGARAPELNMPAAVYVETHGGIGIGGSDDHAGIDIGRTFTQTPAAATPGEFLAHLRTGRVEAHGDQGSAEKWAHAAVALAARTIGRGAAGKPDPAAVMEVMLRVVYEGEAREGPVAADLGPEHGRALLRAWLDSIGFEGDELVLLDSLRSDEFSHQELYRLARRCHERKLLGALDELRAIAHDGGDLGAAARCMFDACLAAVPYAPATAFQAKQKAALTRRDGERARVALVADGVGGMHGVTHTLDEIRDRGVPGFDVEVIGTDPGVDRRLPAVADMEVPFYAGLKVGMPTVPALVETLAEGRYDLVHLCSPGPAGVGAALVARMMGLPTVGAYHTELAAYADLRSGDERLRRAMSIALAAFYGSCERVLSPSDSADESLAELGIQRGRIHRWDRGVDTGRFSPARRVEGHFPGEVNVLYAGRQTREKGADLLAEAFLAARDRDPRLHLVLAGGGPEEGRLRERLGSGATFLGWLEGDELAQAYASADVFLFASRTDTFGQVILEAQASGLPVVAVNEGGPAGLIADGHTGLLREAECDALAGALVELAGSPRLRKRLASDALDSVQQRTWGHALARLADGYAHAVGEAHEKSHVAA